MSLLNIILLLSYIFVSFKLLRSVQHWWTNNKQIGEHRIFLFPPVKVFELKDIFKPFQTTITLFYLVGVVVYFGSLEAIKFFLVLICIILDFVVRFPESNNILESNNLNIGYGAALCYHKNYLKEFLPDNFKERIETFKAVNKVAVFNKLFILVPLSCKVFPDLKSTETLKVERCRELPPHEQTHSGFKKRIYNITIYQIRKNNDAKGVRMAVEYAQPLKGLFALKKKQKISNEAMLYERQLFVKTLQNFLRANDSYKYCELIEYNDDKDEGADVLFERCRDTPFKL